MRTSEQTDKLIPAMLKATEGMHPVAKSGNNTFDKYRYAKLEDYINIVDPAVKAAGLVVSSTITEYSPIPDGRTTTKGNKENACTVKLAFRVTHPSGQWLEIDAIGEGQDRADKSLYKSITGARKYGLAMLFNLVTTDDAESDLKVGTGEDEDNYNKHGQPRASAPAAQPTESYE